MHTSSEVKTKDFETFSHSSTDATGESISPSTSLIFLPLSLTSFSSRGLRARKNESDLNSYNAQWNIREGREQEAELTIAGKRETHSM